MAPTRPKVLDRFEKCVDSGRLVCIFDCPGFSLCRGFPFSCSTVADGIELDTHLSADGVPVVIHDFSVDATTDGSGRVREMTLAQLKQLDAGVHSNPAFAGERIPTLKEVLQAFGNRLLVNIELKSVSPRDDGLEQTVIALVEQHRLENRVLFSSFNPFSLRRAKRIAPHIPVGLLYAPSLPLPR